MAQTSIYKHIMYDNEHSNACQRRECCEEEVGGNSLSRKPPPYSALFRLIFWRPEATRAGWREPGTPVRKGRILHTPLDRTDLQSSRC